MVGPVRRRAAVGATAEPSEVQSHLVVFAKRRCLVEVGQDDIRFCNVGPGQNVGFHIDGNPRPGSEPSCVEWRCGGRSCTGCQIQGQCRGEEHCNVWRDDDKPVNCEQNKNKCLWQQCRIVKTGFVVFFVFAICCFALVVSSDVKVRFEGCRR